MNYKFDSIVNKTEANALKEMIFRRVRERSENLAEEYVAKREFSFSVAYDQYEKVKYMLKDFSVSAVTEDFCEKVTLGGKIVEAEFGAFAARLKDMTNGAIVL